MEILEQPGKETHIHNAVTIWNDRHENINKQGEFLADVNGQCYSAQRRGLHRLTVQYFALRKESS